MNITDLVGNADLNTINGIAGGLGAMGGGFSLGILIAGMIFSGIGFVAFIYGKSRANFKLMAVGGALFIYPYFVPGAVMSWAIGIVLTIVLYLCRE